MESYRIELEKVMSSMDDRVMPKMPESAGKDFLISDDG